MAALEHGSTPLKRWGFMTLYRLTESLRQNPPEMCGRPSRPISEEPAITQAFGVTGDLDAVLIGHFGDMEESQALCDRLLDSDPDVVRYTTLFAVETYKETTEITPQIATSK
jgi:Lrp/AsnC family leucine-responsive transcriptional regulator